MPHYNDLCQLSPFNFMENAAKEDDAVVFPDEGIPSSLNLMPGQMIWFDEASDFTEEMRQTCLSAAQKASDPPILTDDGPKFFSRDLFLAARAKDHEAALEQSRTVCLAGLRRKGVNEATIKQELRWHDGHQKWELTLWGTNAD